MDKVQCSVCKVAGVGVIIAGSRGRVEVSSWGNRVCACSNGRHGTSHALSDALVDVKFSSGRVFSVSLAGTWSIRKDTADRVVGGVHEVHVRVFGLVLIASPAVENISGIGVKIDEISDLGVGIHNPLDGLGLWLGERSSSCKSQQIELR